MKNIIILLVCLFPLSISSQDLLLRIDNPQVSGDLVTYDLSADNFTDMIAAQFSIRYDTSLMKFDSIINSVLPGWDELSYYESEPGAIVIVWFELGIQGVTFPNGTVLFQLQFVTKNGSFGGVCFSQEPVESEFLTTQGEVNSFFIVDDCHDEPFEVIINPTSTEALALEYGMKVNRIVQSQKINFILDNGQEIGFRLFDLDGKQLESYPVDIYSPGTHSLDISTSLISGVYVLVAEVDQKYIPFKIISPE